MALSTPTMEIDNVLKMSFKHLHSSNADSAEKIRLALDDILKQRYGSPKMLKNTLNKKILAEEVSVSESSKPAEAKNNNSTAAKSVSNVNTCDAISIASEEENFNEFGDLVCVLCGAMVVTAGNRLVECRECFSLYHQECHKPSISDNDANSEDSHWSCSNCKHKFLQQNVITDLTLSDDNDVTIIQDPAVLKTANDAVQQQSSSSKIKSTLDNNLNKDNESSSSNPKSMCTTNIISAPEKQSSEKRTQSSKKKSKHHDIKRKK